MKILWVCPFFPYPPDNGTRIREYFLLRELSNWNDVSVFSLVQSSKELENTGDLNQFCQNVWGILPQNKLPEAFFDGKRQVTDVVAGLFMPRPQFFYGKPSPNVVNELRAHIEAENFDVVVIEHLLMSNYVWELNWKIKTTIMGFESGECGELDSKTTRLLGKWLGWQVAEDYLLSLVYSI